MTPAQSGLPHIHGQKSSLPHLHSQESSLPHLPGHESSLSHLHSQESSLPHLPSRVQSTTPARSRIQSTTPIVKSPVYNTCMIKSPVYNTYSQESSLQHLQSRVQSTTPVMVKSPVHDTYMVTSPAYVTSSQHPPIYGTYLVKIPVYNAYYKMANYMNTIIIPCSPSATWIIPGCTLIHYCCISATHVNRCKWHTCAWQSSLGSPLSWTVVSHRGTNPGHRPLPNPFQISFVCTIMVWLSLYQSKDIQVEKLHDQISWTKHSW